MSFDKEDFYMVLPSNASPDTHPENNASSFTVDWSTPIQLDPNANWKVALTEVNYIYHPHAISSNLSITYTKMEMSTHPMKIGFYFQRVTDLEAKVVMITDFSRQKFKMTATIEMGKLRLWSKTPFDVFNKPELGFADNGLSHEPQSSGWYLAQSGVSPFMITRETSSPIAYTLDVVFYDFNEVSNKISFTNDSHVNSGTQLVDYLRPLCKNVFSDMKMDGKKFCFQMAHRVSKVKFEGGLNFILGFLESEFKSETNMLRRVNSNEAWNQTYYKADYSPQLNVGIKNMYIYASCVAPLSVGHTRCPLLKNIFVDASHDGSALGSARNYVVQHLMYVDVMAPILNSITINIRNDAGNVVAFPKGAVTVLTVHFKKFPKQV